MLRNVELENNKLIMENLLRRYSDISPLDYTEETYAEFVRALESGMAALDSSGVDADELECEISNIHYARKELKNKNLIKFKNSLGEIYFQISFDNMTIIATGINENVINSSTPQEKILGIEIYDRKGIKKFNEFVLGDENTLKIVNSLDGFKLEKGDYLKFYDRNKLIEIVGEIINGNNSDINMWFKSLDLSNSLFYIENNNLRFETIRMNISANTEELENILSQLNSRNLNNYYTTETYNYLEKAMIYGENVLKESYIKESQVENAVGYLKKSVTQLKNKTKIVVYGYNNRCILTLRIDYNQMKIIATDGISRKINEYYPTTRYFQIKLYGKNGNLKYTKTLTGNEGTSIICEELNERIIEIGDYLQFYHAESKSRLCITEKVGNLENDLNKGCGQLDLSISSFILLDRSCELRYSDKKITVNTYKEVLEEEILDAKQISEAKYESNSYINLQSCISEGEILLKKGTITIDEIVNQLNKLKSIMKELKLKSKVIFRTENNRILTIEIDEKNKKIISNGMEIESYGEKSLKNKKDIGIILYDKNNMKKFDFNLGENDSRKILAITLNDISYEIGDYLKFYQKNSDRYFNIEGYVENDIFNFEIPSGSLDLENSKFMIKNGILSYINETNL